MSFSDRFWTGDYESGIKALFEQLFEGLNENEDFIQLFDIRMSLELAYGTQMLAIEKVIKSRSKRQENEDFVSSIKNAYFKLNENFSRQGEYHIQIATNIKHRVIEPFSKWCAEHRQRIEFSESEIQEKQRAFKSGKNSLERLQKRYFNRCRMLEEFKSHYTEEEINEELRDALFSEKANTSASSGSETQKTNSGGQEEEVYHFGSEIFSASELQQLLQGILSGVELTSHRVPILGTYSNVSTGSSITQWLLDNITYLEKNIAKAESFAQGLLSNGFIRSVGSMGGGKSFINSSQFFYQWRHTAFELSGIPEPESKNAAPENNVSLQSSMKGSNFSDYIEDMKVALSSVDFKDKSQLPKLIAQVDQLDTQYYKHTVALDGVRCELEETIMDHLSFMQKCELDRLRAVKKVTFDFISCFVNKFNAMKATCEELLVLEETINPTHDLKFLIENYATGTFRPQVILYDNYYNSNIMQTFGVDLEVKARLDRKVVPLIIQQILSYLDKIYPEFPNDEERIKLWTRPVHLSKVHELRASLNNIESDKITEVLAESLPIVITNVLKLYLMELPVSVIPHEYYDLIKSLYQNYAGREEKSKTDARLNGLQNILMNLPKCNLATLDAILTHLSRLTYIIGTKNQELADEFQARLAREFGGLIIRPKMISSGNDKRNRVFLNDKHQFYLLSDLFRYRKFIFSELRQKNSSKSDNPSRNSSYSSRKSSKMMDSTEEKNYSEKNKSKKGILNSKVSDNSYVTKDQKENKYPSDMDMKGTEINESMASTPPQSPRVSLTSSPKKQNLKSLLKDSNNEIDHTGSKESFSKGDKKKHPSRSPEKGSQSPPEVPSKV